STGLCPRRKHPGKLPNDCQEGKQKALRSFERRASFTPGGDLLSHTVSRAVPSALEGLTSLFGMGRGVTPPPLPPECSCRRTPYGARPEAFTTETNDGSLNHLTSRKSDQAARTISTGRLNASLRLHLRPINLVISEGPLASLCWGISHLGASFALRCFQRLSHPDIATRQYRWHDNRYTRGPSDPVLSY